MYGRPVTVLLLERLALTALFAYGGSDRHLLRHPSVFARRLRVHVVGLATPNFPFALILMYLLLTLFGVSPGGLFSAEFEHAPWSFAKFLNGLGHLPLPIIGSAWPAPRRSFA